MSAFALWIQVEHVHSHVGASTPDALSLFNHHLAGWLLMAMGLFSFLEESPLKKHRWLRYLWPSALILLSVYLLLRSDSEKFSSLALSHILDDPEDIQHKLFALLALTIGLIEMLRRVGKLKNIAWGYLLYVGMFVGGMFLLFHGGHHSAIVHQEHFRMGLTCIGIALVKTISDLLPTQLWLRAVALPALFISLGAQLALYVE